MVDTPAFPRAVYPSRRDGWLVVVMWAGVGAMGYAAHALWHATPPVPLRELVVGLLLALGALVLWLLYGTSYTLEGREMRVRCGPFRQRLDLDTVEEVHPSSNPLSAPACSLDRLHLRTRGSRFGLLISPRDKEAFLRDLGRRLPELEPVGAQRLRRR